MEFSKELEKMMLKEMKKESKSMLSKNFKGGEKITIDKLEGLVIKAGNKIKNNLFKSLVSDLELPEKKTVPTAEGD